MLNMSVYQQIHRFKKKGATKTDIVKYLSLNFRTVAKYYDMSGQEYLEYVNALKHRTKAFESLKEDILEVYRLNGNRKLQKTAVYDYLEEINGVLPGSERSLRNYIDYLTETDELKFNEKVRFYKSVPELPYGRQLQVDLGEYKLKDGPKLYIFAGVLSASRYKYVSVQDRPLTTLDLIGHLLDCFEYIGGRPEELVIDQDRLMVVSENHGDIIYTRDFQYFIEEMELKMYVCRKADPESKGKVENLIKFVKGNFLSPRQFESLKETRDRLRAWLIRRANGKICAATKRIPADMIEEERRHLRLLKRSIYEKDSLLGREPRIVNEKSMISVDASQYSVPESYRNKEAFIFKADTRLFIFDCRTGEQIAEHRLSPVPGAKVIDRQHFRSQKRLPGELKEELLQLFDLDPWKKFVRKNYNLYMRYFRDQYREAMKYFSRDVETEYLKQALELCLDHETYSIANLHDAYAYYSNLEKEESRKDVLMELRPHLKDISEYKKNIRVSKRGLGAYKSMINIILTMVMI